MMDYTYKCDNPANHESAGFLLHARTKSDNKELYIFSVSNNNTTICDIVTPKSKNPFKRNPALTALDYLTKTIGKIEWDHVPAIMGEYSIGDRCMIASLPGGKGKWIHCFQLVLTNKEYDQLVSLDGTSDNFLVSISSHDVFKYVRGMNSFDKRDKQIVATEYESSTPRLLFTRLSNDQPLTLSLGVSNLVLLSDIYRQAMTAKHH